MDFIPDLVHLGFTEYEAKVYLALLQTHPANGYQLSKQAGVPRSMVYEALGRLHARGAVLKTGNGKVTYYRPLPPDILLERYEREQSSLISRLSDGLELFYSEKEEDLLWSITGRGPVLSYAAQMITRAHQEVLMILNDAGLKYLRETIYKACDAGLQVSVLLTGEEELERGYVTRHPPMESELQEITDLLVFVVDDEQVLIGSLSGGVSATITSNRNLVFIARQFIWMELFTQRIVSRLGPELLSQLNAEDRRLLDGFSG